MYVWNGFNVGKFWLTHPYPHETVATLHWVCGNSCRGRNIFLTWDFGTQPFCRKAHAMVATLDLIAYALPVGKRQQPMRAAICHRHIAALRRAIHNQWDVENSLREKCLTKLVLKTSDVPSISNE